MEDYDIHPFNNEWTFWVIQVKHVGTGVQYEIEPVITFGTIEGFWNAFVQFPTIADIKQGGIALFKNGIKPAWEDPQNIGGQSWTISPDSFNQKEWTETVIKVISGDFEQTIGEHAPQLCGLYVQKKHNGVSVELWFGPGACEALTVQKAIGITGKQPIIKPHPKVPK